MEFSPMPNLSILDMLIQATLVVQLVLALLISMSIASWSLIFMKWFTLTKARAKARKDLESFLNAEDLQGAVRTIGADKESPAYRVALHGVNELNRLEGFAGVTAEEATRVIIDNVRRALRTGISQETGRVGHSLGFLATCGNAAPFIGLFGTVWGIMHSFHSIGQMKTAALAAVAPGISEALVATAIGLAVAIPATIAFNSFLGVLNEIEAELVNFAGAFLNRVQRELPAMFQDQ